MAEPLPILVIVGPTGAGKTVLALARARALGGEIISADSVQVYRGLDIGSAKPTRAERDEVHHHLVDVCDPSEQINAGAWVAAAEPIIADPYAVNRATGALLLVDEASGATMAAGMVVEATA